MKLSGLIINLLPVIYLLFLLIMNFAVYKKKTIRKKQSVISILVLVALSLLAYFQSGIWIYIIIPELLVLIIIILLKNFVIVISGEENEIRKSITKVLKNTYTKYKIKDNQIIADNIGEFLIKKLFFVHIIILNPVKGSAKAKIIFSCFYKFIDNVQ